MLEPPAGVRAKRNLGACLALSAGLAANVGSAQTSEHGILELVGVQFRLIWPLTGGLSPDVFAAQAADAGFFAYCGDWAFPNGESAEALGAPSEAVLLVGVRAPEEAPPGIYGDMGHVQVVQPTGVSDPFHRSGMHDVTVAAMRGETRWFTVGVVHAQAPVERLQLRLNGVRIDVPDVREGCAE